MSTTLSSATNTLLHNYDLVATAGARFPLLSGANITRANLEAVLADPDPSIPQDVRDAAQFLLDSPASRHYLDVAAGAGGLDGRISRDDLLAAARDLAGDGHHADLLDTAAGRGGWNPFAGARDGNISPADIQAALTDPGVPDVVKDALRLLLSGDVDPAQVGSAAGALDDAGFTALASLYGSPGFAGLADGDRQLLVAAVIDSGGDPAVCRDLQTRIGDPSFQAMTPPQRTAALTEEALLQTPEFKELPAGDQRLVREALDNRPAGDTSLPASIKSLIESAPFQSADGFSTQERTAILSQVRNYPDSRTVENLERLVGKEWFRDFGLDDTQRAAKTVAFLSQHDAGDQTIISNTLALFLSDAAPYRFDFSEDSAYGSVPFSPEDLFRINPRFIGADNNPVDTSQRSAEMGELRVIGHTFVHEVNHMRNWDRNLSLNSSYGFHEEYRAYMVGVQAQLGSEPAVGDVIDRVASFVNHDGSYDHLAHLLDAGGQDAREIVEYLNTILGRTDLTVANARQEVNALVALKKQADVQGGPLPDSLARPAGVTVGPEGTNNRTNE